MASKIDKFAHLLPELSDEQIADMADVKPATVAKYRAKLEAPDADGDAPKPDEGEGEPEASGDADGDEAEVSDADGDAPEKAEADADAADTEEPEPEDEVDEPEPPKAAKPQGPLVIRVTKNTHIVGTGRRTVRGRSSSGKPTSKSRKVPVRIPITRSIYRGEMAEMLVQQLDEDAYEVLSE